MLENVCVAVLTLPHATLNLLPVDGLIVDSFLARLCKVLHNIIYTFQLSLARAVVVGQSSVREIVASVLLIIKF